MSFWREKKGRRERWSRSPHTSGRRQRPLQARHGFPSFPASNNFTPNTPQLPRKDRKNKKVSLKVLSSTAAAAGKWFCPYFYCDPTGILKCFQHTAVLLYATASSCSATQVRFLCINNIKQYSSNKIQCLL